MRKELILILRYVTRQLFSQFWTDPFISKLSNTVELYQQFEKYNAYNTICNEKLEKQTKLTDDYFL